MPDNWTILKAVQTPFKKSAAHTLDWKWLKLHCLKITCENGGGIVFGVKRTTANAGEFMLQSQDSIVNQNGSVGRIVGFLANTRVRSAFGLEAIGAANQ